MTVASVVSASLHVEVDVVEIADLQSNELDSHVAAQSEGSVSKPDGPLGLKTIDRGFQRGLSVPPDNSTDPLLECPGLDPDYCLPGDADLDYDVDFLDFLILSNNFGLTNASWVDGDFDGDAEVGFSDFVILTNNYGLSVQLPPSAASSAAAPSDSIFGDGDRANFGDGDRGNRDDWAGKTQPFFARRTESEAVAIRPGQAISHVDVGWSRW